MSSGLAVRPVIIIITNCFMIILAQLTLLAERRNWLSFQDPSTASQTCWRRPAWYFLYAGEGCEPGFLSSGLCVRLGMFVGLCANK